MYGTDWGSDDVVKIGQQIIRTERNFNERAGFTKEHDRVPEFMKIEKLPPHNTVFDVSDEELDSVYKF